MEGGKYPQEVVTDYIPQKQKSAIYVRIFPNIRTSVRRKTNQERGRIITNVWMKNRMNGLQGIERASKGLFKRGNKTKKKCGRGRGPKALKCYITKSYSSERTRRRRNCIQNARGGQGGKEGGEKGG